jgi:hypothetical protein
MVDEIRAEVGQAPDGLGSIEEIVCDVFAARVVALQRDELDGDRMMRESLPTTPEEYADYLRMAGLSKSDIETLKPELDKFADYLRMDDLSKLDIKTVKAKIEAVESDLVDYYKGAVTLGIEADWFPTATSCLLLLRLSTSDALGSVDVAWARALLVTELAYGVDAVANLRADAIDQESLLYMLTESGRTSAAPDQT